MTTSPAERLISIVTADDCTDPMWAAVESGEMDLLVPEFMALQLEQDPIHRHKDVLAHTIAVMAKTQPYALVRLGALFHDIGKPATRSFELGKVTFHNHEPVGAKITKRRMREMEFDEQMVRDVGKLVYLSGRFKGYGDGDGWSDAAVRRYCRDAGRLLGDLNHMIRCDVTSRNPRKVQRLQRLMDELEARIAELAREDAIKAERPEIDGARVMEHLGIEPGPAVGKAMRFLLALKREEGEMGDEAVLARLDDWWADQQAAQQ